MTTLDRTRFLEAFAAASAGPARYGVNDCCLTVADALVAAGGPDLMAGWRGRYRTRFGFLRIIRKAGLPDLPTAIQTAFERHLKPSQNPWEDMVLTTGAWTHDGKVFHAPFFRMDGWWHTRGPDGPLSFQLITRRYPGNPFWRVA